MGSQYPCEISLVWLYAWKNLEILKSTVGKNSSRYATSLFNLAKAYQKKGNVKAEKHFKESLKIRKKNLGVKHPLYGKILPYLAINEWEQGNAEESLEYFKQTFDNYFNQIDTYFAALSESEKTKFYSLWGRDYYLLQKIPYGKAISLFHNMEA